MNDKQKAISRLPINGLSRTVPDNSSVKKRANNLPRSVIKKLREGNHAAFEMIHNAYQKDIKLFLLTITRSEHITEEVLQETFVYLWEKRENIDPEKSLVNYLFHVARNAVLMRLRRAQVENKYLQSLDPEQVSNMTADSAMIEEETNILVHIIAANMPKQRRMIFELSRFEGLSNEEIAQKLGIKPGNVRTQLHYALKEVKDIVGLFIAFFIVE